MAEIRKFNPTLKGAIAEAVATAMGEPVRPITPGEKAVADAQENPATRKVTTFTWSPAPVRRPPADA